MVFKFFLFWLFVFELFLQSMFCYSFDFWSNNEIFNLEGGKIGFDLYEIKLLIYWGIFFSKICFGMQINGYNRFLVIDRQVDFLYLFIVDGEFCFIFVGCVLWIIIIGNLVYL